MIDEPAPIARLVARGVKRVSEEKKMCRQHLRGFTLLEVLVAVGIIILLAGLLFPLIGKARESGKRTQCLASLKSLTAAWLAYAAENDRHLCNADPDGGTPDNTNPDRTWAWVSLEQDPNTGFKLVRPAKGVLFKYVNNASFFRCPDDITDLKLNPVSYQMNGMLQGSLTRGALTNAYKKLDDIPRPSQTFVFIEGCNPKVQLLTNFITPIYPVTYFRRNGWPAGNHKDGGSVGVGTSISFADGHAEFWKYADVRTGSLMIDVLNGKYGPAFVGKSGPPTYTDVAMTNSPDVFQLLNWSGGPTPPATPPQGP